MAQPLFETAPALTALNLGTRFRPPRLGSDNTVNDILFGQLTIRWGSEPELGTAQGTDILRVSDNGDTTADRGGRLTAPDYRVLGMTVGIKYTSFGDL